MWRRRLNCRVCQTYLSELVLDLGLQSCGARFPLPNEPDLPVAPIQLMRCSGCGLLQLSGSVESTEIWTEGYGYRSGVNQTMRDHLAGIVKAAAERVQVRPHDVVLDIASNDGTLLSAWRALEPTLNLVGIDPVASGPEDADIVREFFTADSYFRYRPAKVVTSIACLYDLDDPVRFASDVEKVLARDGIWILEVGYAGDMLEGAWDTILHEHRCYYRFRDLERIVEAAGLVVVEAERNEINGGTLRLYVSKGDGKGITFEDYGNEWIFDTRVANSISAIQKEVARRKREGESLYLLGASAKGNCLLQACGIGHAAITGASERNPAKHGRVTPVTRIPIVSEEEARAKADSMLVLPWAFRDEIIEREEEFLNRGGELVFPLPVLEVVSKRKAKAS